MKKSFENVRFFRCSHCGNIITLVQDNGVPVMCCGQQMEELIPGTSDGAHEKHVPAVNVEGDVVTAKIGSVEHPMLDVHYIQWICLVTDKGVHFRSLLPGEAPEAVFTVPGEKPAAVYEYCNLHGLWKTEL